MTSTFSSLNPGDVLHGRYRVDFIQHTTDLAQWVRCTHAHIQRELLLIRFSEELSQGKRGKKLLARCRATSPVKHPHLSTIYDYGINGTPPEMFVVLDPLDGQLLMDVLKVEKILYPVRAYKIIKSVLLGLEQLHHRQLVHQSVDWSSVFIGTGADQQEHVKMLSLALPRENQCLVCHPPEYRHTTPTPAFDIYMAGVLMITLLMEDGYTWFSSLMNDVYVPEELVDSPIGPILQRALDPEPEQRFRSASALLHAVNMIEIEHLHYALGQTPPQGIPAVSKDMARTSLSRMPLLAGKSSVLSQPESVATAKTFDSKQTNPWRRLVYKEMLESAHSAYQRGLYTEALRLFERCALEEPDNKDILEHMQKITSILKSNNEPL